ncbi:glycosyl hydrolase family 88 [Thiospirochaeta perfilievii]|uniref:Glycosyl hydrolase family 88 n=1 Tax=Thiospirochaeta perfilievii TaxID=252967 RepID=A0A5C1QCD3_9SPIO|nr:glycoside hydrolase family 88 protein [Thiospirochaeta perfilievii]QEN04316.1 glycosyl hydrolase family 88 [Thiospirochaeta perfilievii]
MIDRYIDRLLLDSSPQRPLWNQEMIIGNKKPHWNYIDGCMMTAFLTLYEKSFDKKYLDFVDNFIDYFIEDNGSIKSFDIETYNLDNINEGRALYKLHDYTGKKKYRKAIENLYIQLQLQPRTKEGNFWHKGIYPNQIWLDGLYMAQPFYLEYEKRFNNKKNYIDILNQIKNVVKLMKNKETGLYYHAYDSSRDSSWSNEETGLSQNYWLRAEGWFLMALVDILEIVEDKKEELYSFVSKTLLDLIEALIKYQDISGMWFQVVDKIDEPRNYLETSGSSIISYAILKAVRLGIISKEFKPFGEKAFNGICNKYLFERDGEMNLGGICLVAGLGGKDNRDGSFDYYMSEPVVENEAKGIAPFLLAYLQE